MFDFQGNHDISLKNAPILSMRAVWNNESN